MCACVFLLNPESALIALICAADYGVCSGNKQIEDVHATGLLCASALRLVILSLNLREIAFS